MNTLLNMKILPAYFKTIKREDTRTMIGRALTEMEELLDKPFLAMTENDVRAFADRLRLSCVSEGRSIKYMNKKFSLCRGVAGYIEENASLFGISYSNPFKGFVFYNSNADVLPGSIPSKEDINTLLAYASANDETLFVAITLILRLSLSSGELVGIKRSDFCKADMDESFYVLALKKRGRARFIRLPKDVEDIVISYINNPDYYPSDGNYSLLVNSKGDRLILRTLQARFKKAASAAGLDNKYSMNDIRNASIAYALSCGASGNEVAQFAGISERWMYRYTHSVNDMQILSGDFTNIKVVR